MASFGSLESTLVHFPVSTSTPTEAFLSLDARSGHPPLNSRADPFSIFDPAPSIISSVFGGIHFDPLPTGVPFDPFSPKFPPAHATTKPLFPFPSGGLLELPTAKRPSTPHSHTYHDVSPTSSHIRQPVTLPTRRPSQPPPPTHPSKPPAQPSRTRHHPASPTHTPPTHPAPPTHTPPTHPPPTTQLPPTQPTRAVSPTSHTRQIQQFKPISPSVSPTHARPTQPAPLTRPPQTHTASHVKTQAAPTRELQPLQALAGPSTRVTQQPVLPTQPLTPIQASFTPTSRTRGVQTQKLGVQTHELQVEGSQTQVSQASDSQTQGSQTQVIQASQTPISQTATSQTNPSTALQQQSYVSTIQSTPQAAGISPSSALVTNSAHTSSLYSVGFTFSTPLNAPTPTPTSPPSSLARKHKNIALIVGCVISLLVLLLMLVLLMFLWKRYRRSRGISHAPLEGTQALSISDRLLGLANTAKTRLKAIAMAPGEYRSTRRGFTRIGGEKLGAQGGPGLGHRDHLNQYVSSDSRRSTSSDVGLVRPFGEDKSSDSCGMSHSRTSSYFEFGDDDIPSYEASFLHEIDSPVASSALHPFAGTDGGDWPPISDMREMGMRSGTLLSHEVSSDSMCSTSGSPTRTSSHL